jgi:SAM-dependent methyltransferase
MFATTETAHYQPIFRPEAAPDRRDFLRPGFRISDVWKAPLDDFPIRDEILYQYLRFSKTTDALEIGPGTGFTAFRLSQHLRSLTLVDVAAESLSVVRKNLQSLRNVRCVCTNPAQPGFADDMKQHFDVAFALDVFQYIAQPAAFLLNLHKALRPHGELFLTYPNVLPPVGDGVNYFTHISELETLLGRAGFQNWSIYSVRKRSLARTTYEFAHERPMGLLRRMRSTDHDELPQTYEGTWAFKNSGKFKHLKLPVHAYWFLLDKALRIGGDAFVSEPIGNGILGRQIVIHAWK